MTSPAGNPDAQPRQERGQSRSPRRRLWIGLAAALILFGSFYVVPTNPVLLYDQKI